MARLTLTFDNGPDPTWTPHVLDVLGRHDIKATFFTIGRKVDFGAEARPILERAHGEGHWIGTHTYNHIYSLGDIDRPDAFDLEVEKSFDAIGDLAHPDLLFRPFCNAGIVDDRVFKRVDVDRLIAGGYTCIFFNSLPHDWDDGEGWVGRGLADIKTREWSTIVVHDIAGYPDGVDARPMARLEDFVTSALDAGHEFVQEFSPDTVLIQRGEPLRDIDFLMH
ncbi:MAG TPA: polysaccharide deacetylase family protein [Solirubrobacterales bacterium]|jgi:peptidoglycan/xylan/chitin deacetylase (PgdA/CDA1 family)